MVLQEVASGASAYSIVAHNMIKDFLPASLGLSFDILIAIFGIVFFVLFIYSFYNSLSSEDFPNLNLPKYAKSDNPSTAKFYAISLFFIEHIFIAPILISLWFIGLSIMFLLIAVNYNVAQVLVISAAIIGAVRVLSYYKEKLAEETAKILLFAALLVFLIGSSSVGFDKIANQFSSVPLLFENIFIYIAVIFALEIFLRGYFVISDLIRNEKENPEKEGLSARQEQNSAKFKKEE